ncbi:hypothetical protein [Brevibacillus parabrevis]|uniref:hypothetical protein n=1 Tax=Brevibacillus parabrevis TaxID=54914 RepID=UPI0028D7F999|nr:hypothetical protein [Brevibacillus parabrevis]MED1723460.1 hypothetical protein [Brevibacillus parabrevis]
MATFREALKAKNHLVKKWKRMPGVMGIGVGYVNGRNNKKGACVVLYTLDASAAVKKGCPSCVAVKRKKGGKRPKIASHVAVPVRTVTSGRCSSHLKWRATSSYRRRIRPVIAGVSVGYPGASGTAGLIVTGALRRAQRFLLSNNHVLNRNNTGGYTETIQPGGSDGGRSGRERIGQLYRFVRLRKNAVNDMDVAISIPTSNNLLAPRYAKVGTIPGYVRSYAIGSRLKKVGRTTGFVHGVVESTHTDINVDYGDYGGLGTIRFRNQTVIRSAAPISLPGDSGSVWLTANNYAAAVNFAGSADGRLSIAFPIHRAMRALGLRVAQPASALSCRKRAVRRRKKARK